MLTLCLIITKGTILFILAKVFLLRKNSSILIALYLSQAGEFGFVLLALAKTAHVVPAYVADNLSLTIALSMLITPVLFFLVQKMKLSDFSKPIDKVSSNNEDGTKIIIIEMSKFGKVASEILIKSGYNVMILDNSSSKVAAFRKEGIKAFSGDTSNPDLLFKAGIQNTDVVIVACQDPEKSIAITDHIINKYPSIKLIVTAIDKEHYKALYDCGAREIILETYYNSILACEKTLLALGEDKSQVKRTLKDFETTDFANLINRTSYKR
jgi:voltage-gated potassium channel Kch